MYGAFIAGLPVLLPAVGGRSAGDLAADRAAKPDLLQIITTDSGPIITRASAKLTDAFMHSWVNATEQDAGVLARAIVRLAMSFVSMPPEADHDVAGDLAEIDDTVRRTLRRIVGHLPAVRAHCACPASPQAGVSARLTAPR